MPGFLGPTAADGSFDEFLARILSGQRPGGYGRPGDISRLLSRRGHELVQRAVRYAVEHGHPGVDALHLLHVLLTQTPLAELVKRTGTDPAALAAAIEERLPAPSEERTEQAPGLTPTAQRAL